MRKIQQGFTCIELLVAVICTAGFVSLIQYAFK